MEENKKGVNVSSGAEKVERIEEATRAKKASPKKKTTRATQKSAPVKAAKSKASVAEKKERQEADKRVALAKKRAEQKEKKLMAKAELKQKKLEKKAKIKERRLARKAEIAKKQAERKQLAQKRRADLKAKRVERRAEKIARREALRHESATQKKRRIEREKKEKLALRRQKQEAQERARAEKRKAQEAASKRRAQERRSKREQRAERRKHAPGFGGWLAATISLGVACLALATVVTSGFFRMNGLTMAAEGSFRTTLYEMVSATEDMDGNLSKLRVSNGANEQRALLTNILVDTALLESALERCPVDQATATDISAYVNRMNMMARGMLDKLARGEKLNGKEHKLLEHLYTVNTAIYQELNTLCVSMTADDVKTFMEGKQGMASDVFESVRKGTLAESEEKVDAPFSEVGNVGKNRLSDLEEVSVQQAEELVKNYFEGYRVRAVEYTGETMGRNVECYNFTLKDEKDVEIFAQITKKGGRLAFFERYEPCTTKNFDLNTCDTLAKEYLAGLGMKDMQAVWLSDSGMVADLTYVSTDSGARVYADMVRVRVCEEKGVVVGMDASRYLLNNSDRNVKASITRAQAEEKLSPALEVRGGALALVPVHGREILAYEFDCTYGEEQFIVYLDAQTGDEVQIYCVRNSAQGRYLR